MLFVCLIVAVFVAIVVWTAIDAPNARPPSPQRRQKEWWG